jgi:hypothetical protein
VRVTQIRNAQRHDVAELHDALLTLLGRLHPERRIISDSAGALIALSLGTCTSQTVLKTNTLPTATLVDELLLLLSERT